LKIRDIDTGEFLPAYKHGEICCHGPQVMKGYLGNQEATETMIGPDGWLRTGDVGYYDQHHYFYVVDRLKDLIKYKAYQVSPSELEDLLVSHPKIADAGVVGFPDLESGELPSAALVLKADEALSVDDVREFVAGDITEKNV
jgi:acyl-CoA synthetase (AMP-forming)/AMP-acid ligase II